jgi:hypothetical protein
MAAFAGLFTACGGGGGGGGGFENGEDASGIWTGFMNIDGNDSSTTNPNPLATTLIVQSNGEFILTNPVLLFAGTASTELTALTANGKGYPVGGAFFLQDGNVELTATVAEGATFTGSYLGSGYSGEYTLDYNAATARPASLAELAGTYSVSLLILSVPMAGTLTFLANGDITGSAGGCTVNGEVSVAEATRNIYNWSISTSGCPQTGLNTSSSGFGYLYNGGGFDRFNFPGRLGITPVIFTGVQQAP